MKTRTYFAQAVSLGMHALGLLALLFLLNQPANSADQLPLVKSNQQLIYVASAPGSSRGGGGSLAQAPPVPTAIPKPQPMTVVPVVSAAPADPPPSINAPVMTSPDALLAASGVDGAVAVPRGGGGSGTGIGPGQGPGLGPGTGPGFGDTGIGGFGGIEMPYRIMEVKPQYTAEAMRAKLQGPVVLEAVLDISGRVTDVRVTKSLDRVFGLDEAARRAAFATPFRPCKKDGRPIACVITFELQFTLR